MGQTSTRKSPSLIQGRSPSEPPAFSAWKNSPLRFTAAAPLNLNHDDTDAANADLDRQCGNGVLIGGGYNFYAIRGGTVAFVCNFGYFYDHHRCYEDTRVQSSKVITEFCGPYNSGWINYEYGWMSYGYDATASDFCGTGV